MNYFEDSIGKIQSKSGKNFVPDLEDVDDFEDEEEWDIDGDFDEAD